jgi:hypothetical protein
MVTISRNLKIIKKKKPVNATKLCLSGFRSQRWCIVGCDYDNRPAAKAQTTLFIQVCKRNTETFGHYEQAKIL